MENRIRIREAVQFAKKRGKKIKKTILAGKVFTYTSQKSAITCLNNYERGFSTKMDRVQVNTICKELGVDANFLFGTPPMIPIINQNTQDNGKEEPSEPAGTVQG